MGKRRYPAISVHLTLHGQLKVDWERKYNYEFDCPHCGAGKLISFSYRKTNTCKLSLYCNSCGKESVLTCRVPIQISHYRRDLECPNPLCTRTGHDGQKGWIYREYGYHKCYFCGIYFNPASTKASSWIGSHTKEKLLPFCFDDDTWDLRHFFDEFTKRTINFQSIQPQWYQLQVKQYLHYLLKSPEYSFREQTVTCLRQFGQVLKQQRIQRHTNITREVILSFIDVCRPNKNYTVSQKLSIIKKFLEWLGLEAARLVRHRDLPKVSRNDVDWLDKVTRTAIKQCLHKIPPPIVHHYLVQEYTAARPRDVCQMSFDCLVEENGKWYVKFYQQKVDRWHKLPVTREIRQVIEKQQEWIRLNLGLDYSYLFCHFRVIRQSAYPIFANIKPLLKPPVVSARQNPMVRIIRMLIEQENVRDTNGQQPRFTGKITRPSRLQEVRVKYGMEAAQLYADHKSSTTTFQHYTPPTREQVASVDLPFQELLMNPGNKFLPWQSLPESLLKNPKVHELDIEIAPRLVVYGHCALNPKTPCPHNLYPKCYGCSSFRPSTGKLSLYERQYAGEQERLQQASNAGAELAYEEAKITVEAMNKWLPQLRRIAND